MLGNDGTVRSLMEESPIDSGTVTPRTAAGLQPFVERLQPAADAKAMAQEALDRIAPEAQAAESAVRKAREAADAAPAGKGAKAAAKQQLVDAAAAAAEAAAEVLAIRDAAVQALDAATEQHAKILADLRREQGRLASLDLVDESRSARAAHPHIVETTHHALRATAEAERLYGSAREANARTERAIKAHERATFRGVRDTVDPHRDRDRRICLERFGDPWLFKQSAPMRAGGCFHGFEKPAPTPRFVYPVHSPPLPYGVRLHQIAKYKEARRVEHTRPVLGRQGPTDAIVRQVQLGDVTMLPANLDAVRAGVVGLDSAQLDSTRLDSTRLDAVSGCRGLRLTLLLPFDESLTYSVRRCDWRLVPQMQHEAIYLIAAR